MSDASRPAAARKAQALGEDSFLAELGADPADLAALCELVEGLAPALPSGDVRARVLATIAGEVAEARTSRWRGFAARIAAMIDVGVERAEAFIAQALGGGWDAGPVPGLTTLWVDGGAAAAGCIRGFVRLEAGLAFPEHRHLGDEATLVLEGALIDSDGTTAEAGELVEMAGGSTHGYRAGAGADLVMFVVVREGIAIGETAIRHRDAL